MIMASRSRLGWAAGLVLSGLFLLIWNFDLLAPYAPWTEILLALVLLVITVGFFSGYLGGQQWWRLIPAWIMAALTVMILLNIVPGVADEVVVALLFVGMATAFVHIYLLQRDDHWWALLPAGFTFVVALIVATSALTHNITVLGALLFGGIGAVFFLLYALSRGTAHWWSLIPGSVLLIFSLMILTAQPDGEATYLRWWPVLLIVGGLAVLWFTDSSSGQNSSAQPRRASSIPPPAPTHSPSRSTSQSDPASASSENDTSSSSRLGEYQQPAPGASVDLLPERDEG